MDRRKFLAGSAACASASVMSETKETIAAPPTLVNPIDREILRDIDRLTQCAADMKAALLSAQTADTNLRDGYLFDMRSALGMLRLCEDWIGRRAWEQAIEVNRRIYQNRQYNRPGRHHEAIMALRQAGWSWRDPTEVVVDEPAMAISMAASWREREEGGERFPVSPPEILS